LLGRVERQHWVSAPLWAVAAVALAPPSLWMVSTWHRQRRQRLRALHGRCPACGYDLRGNDSAACPECGSPFPVTPTPWNAACSTSRRPCRCCCARGGGRAVGGGYRLRRCDCSKAYSTS